MAGNFGLSRVFIINCRRNQHHSHSVISFIPGNDADQYSALEVMQSTGPSAP